MKLVSTNPVVGKTSINAVPVQHYDDGSAQALAQAGRIAAQIGNVQAQGNEMAGRAFGNLGRTVGQIGAVIQHQQEETDAVNAQAAANEYTRRVNDLMYNDENGLMNTKFEGASGITQDFTEQEKKIRQEVYGQYHFHTAKGQMAFNKLADNSAAQRYTMLQRHQYQQAEAYKDVTYNNGLQLNVQAAGENYAAPDIVDSNIKEAVISATARYNGQGAEVVRMQSRKAAGQVAQQAINMAYANGNDDQAAAYIEKYGAYLDPNQRTQYSKAVHQRVLTNLIRNTADTLVAKYGNNTAALYDAIYNRREGGSGYDGAAAVAWMREQAKNGANWGVNTCTLGVNKALTMGGGIPGNTWAPTNWEDAKKAGTAFTDRSQLRTGDIVYWWKPGKDKNADDVGHVGIYDAETGMVYQSGTSGFRPIALDTYSVSGFSRPQGQGMTREQQDALYNACLRQINQQKAMRNAYNDQVYKDLDKQLMGLHDAGNMDYATYTAMVDQVCGADPEMRRKGYQYANYWWRSTAKPIDGSGTGSAGSGSSGSGSSKGGLPIGAEHGLEQTLMHRNFESEADWAQYIMRFNPTKAEYNKLINMYQDKQQGKGIFAYDWDGMKDEFKLDNPKLDDKTINVMWRQATDYAKSMINKSRRDGTEPTYAEVYGYINESMSKVNMGEVDSGKWWKGNESYEPTKGELAQAGITATRHLPSGQIEVQYGNGVTEITTAEGLRHKLSYSPRVTDDYR